MDEDSWAPITDLPADWHTWRSTYLAELTRLWRERKTSLENSSGLREFNRKLIIEWAIETGILENLYTLDRGITQILIEKGLKESLIPEGSTNRPASETLAMIRDHEATIESMFDFIKGDRKLTTSYIKEMHQSLTRHQMTCEAVDQFGNRVTLELQRGEWKRQPNNPTRPDGTTHQYCPPIHIPAEMDRLVTLHDTHEEQGVPPEVEAAWLHHRFTQIHPFQDGNGRVARTLASLVFLKAGLFPLIVGRDQRAAYISALEQADAGQLGRLVDLAAQLQAERVRSALKISPSPLSRRHIPAIGQAIADRLGEKRRRRLAAKDSGVTLELISELLRVARQKMSDYGTQLAKEIEPRGEQFRWILLESWDDPDDPTGCDLDEVFAPSIEKVEMPFDFHMRLGGLGLDLKASEEQACFLVVFGRSSDDPDAVADGVAILTTDFRGEGGIVYYNTGRIVSDHPFHFVFTEPRAAVVHRFTSWLDRTFTVGMVEWQRSI